MYCCLRNIDQEFSVTGITILWLHIYKSFVKGWLGLASLSGILREKCRSIVAV